jgi:hypothetical protein
MRLIVCGFTAAWFFEAPINSVKKRKNEKLTNMLRSQRELSLTRWHGNKWAYVIMCTIVRTCEQKRTDWWAMMWKGTVGCHIYLWVYVECWSWGLKIHTIEEKSLNHILIISGEGGTNRYFCDIRIHENRWSLHITHFVFRSWEVLSVIRSRHGGARQLDQRV